MLGKSRRLVSDVFLEITSFLFMLIAILSGVKIVQKWPKERKTQILQRIGDNGYGQIFFENKPFLAKLQTNMKLNESYYNGK